MLPVADWIILAALAVVITLCVRYARRHPRVPPELSGWHVYCGGQTAVVQFYRNAKNGYLTRCNGLGTLTGKPWRKRCPGSVQSNLAARRALQETWTRQALAAAIPVAAVAVIAGVVSYAHIESLALSVHQPLAAARMLPGSVDFMIVAGSVILLAGSPLGWLGVIPGVAATLFANVESGLPYGPLSATVAAWPAVAFTLATLMLERWLKNTSGAPVPRSSPPGLGTGTSSPALNASGAPASVLAAGSTGTELPPPVPPRREPRRAVNPREARKGPAAASARAVREQEVLQQLLASGAPLPSARQLGAEEFGSYQSASAKRVLAEAREVRAAMNGHGASG